MEKTLEEKVPVEMKDDQGWIGRRLRDRDQLRKRKAEAEEQATNQAESRKRARKEQSSIPRKKGRPRKNIPVEEQPENIEIRNASKPLEMPAQVEEAIASPVSSPAPVSAPVPALVPAPVLAPALIPAQIPSKTPAPLPLSVSAAALEAKPPGDGPQEVLIEDLGPDDEEDQAEPLVKLVPDQGDVEPSSTGVAEQNKGFSDAVFMSPPPDSLPANLI